MRPIQVIIVASLIALLAGGGILTAVLSTSNLDQLSGQTTWQARRWEGATPLRCDGHDRIRITHATVSITRGVAVIATENCKLEIRNARIQAPIGIKVTGSAHVRFEGTLEASEVGIDVQEHGAVVLRGMVLGINDPAGPGIGMRLAGEARADVDRSTISGHDAIVMREHAQLRLRDTGVQSAGVGIVARGEASFTLTRPGIYAGGVALRVLERARGEAHGGYIEGYPAPTEGNRLTLDETRSVVAGSR